MGRRIVVKRAGAKRGSRLDLPMAVLAALAVGFVAYAVPAALLADAVAATGLPSILPAAAPPLGATARLSLVTAGALAAFLGTWLLLRALGGRAPIRLRAEPEAIPAAPRLRRADLHPDAPAPRPLRVDLEFDEPEAAEPDEAEEIGSVTVAETARVEEPLPAPPLDLDIPTIGELMQRLEAGLVQRRTEPSASARPAAPARPTPVSANDAVDERLRGALDELQKLVARSA